MSTGHGDDGKAGPWYQVPTWDGSPLTWREFQRSMKWWLASLDLPSTSRYNLAARWLLRQTGIVRQRGEEFDPKDLEYKAAVTMRDPATDEEFELEPADYLHGLNKLLKALEDINGQTVLDKRGELRQQFYLDLQRRPGERVSEFCTRFRTLTADLQAEGVILPPTELGWFMKNKMGLDPLRKQLLETALNGLEEYAVIEGEVLRLFKELHLQDPLYRKAQPDRPKLSIRRMFQGAPSSFSGSSSSTQSSVSRSPSMFSGPSSKKSSTSHSSGQTRKVYLTEVPEEADGDGEDDFGEPADGGDAAVEAAPDQSLESYLQSEVECLATELQEAEEQGADHEAIASVEADFEQAAEALVTMKEARSRLQEIRKDRGFGKPATASGKDVPAARKASGRHPCFDCLQHGHWAGDKECPRPGAGLGRKNSAGKGSGAGGGKGKPRQVRVAEVLLSDHNAVGTSSSTPLPTPSTDVPPQSVHEVSMVNHLGPMSLKQAIEVSTDSRAHHDACVSSAHAQALADEKQLVGALDSACNRTCCGQLWLDRFLEQLRVSAPQEVQDLVQEVDQFEKFKFGNGGVVPSSKRWRIPICLSNSEVLLLWISVVPIGSLGCLLGRDFLDALGTVLNFGDRTVEFRCLRLGRLKLGQLTAGHFMLSLMPTNWPRLGAEKWRKCGLDNVIELQLKPAGWLAKRLAEGSQGHLTGSRHEHMLTESSVKAAYFWHESFCTMTLARKMSPEQSLMLSHQLPLLPGEPRDLPRTDGKQCSRDGVRQPSCVDSRTDPTIQGSLQSCLLFVPMAKNVLAFDRSCTMALAWSLAVAVGAFLIALCAFSISFHCYPGGLEHPRVFNGGTWLFAVEPPPHGMFAKGLQRHELGTALSVPRPSWLEVCVPGGFLDFGHPGDALNAWPSSSPSSCCLGRNSCQDSGRNNHPGTSDSCQGYDWPSRWFTPFEGRFDSSVCALGCEVGPQGHGCQDPGEDQACGRGLEDIYPPVAKSKAAAPPSTPSSWSSVPKSPPPEQPLPQDWALVQMESRIQQQMATQEQKIHAMLTAVVNRINSQQQVPVAMISQAPPVINVEDDEQMSG